MEKPEFSAALKVLRGSGLLSRLSASAAAMFQELKFQLSTAILTILTIAAGCPPIINLDEQYHFRLPDDGVIWADRSGGGPGAARSRRQSRREGRHPRR